MDVLPIASPMTYSHMTEKKRRVKTELRHKDNHVVPPRLWWGWSAYRIEGGLIVPADGAELVPSNEGVHPGEWPADRPYNSLLRMLPRLRLVQTAAGAYEPDGDSATAITDWCAQNGPLCPILGEMLQVRTKDGTWTRSGGRWSHRELHEVQLASLGAGGLDVVPVPSGIDGIRASDEPTAGALWTHFVGRKGGVPGPATPEFIRDYREPVHSFIHAARYLERGLLAAELIRRISTGEASPKEIDSIGHWLEALAHLTAATSLHLALGWDAKTGKPAGLIRQWVSASQISALAFQALRDLEENADKGGGIRRCPECGAVFVGLSYQAKYCSPRCRQAVLTRGYRARQRELDFPPERARRTKAKGPKGGKKR